MKRKIAGLSKLARSLKNTSASLSSASAQAKALRAGFLARNVGRKRDPDRLTFTITGSVTIVVADPLPSLRVQPGSYFHSAAIDPKTHRIVHRASPSPKARSGKTKATKPSVRNSKAKGIAR